MARRMPIDPKTEAARRYFEELDERRALQRFVDQPGQWEDVTPLEVKKRQDKELKKLTAMIAARRKKSYQ